MPPLGRLVFENTFWRYQTECAAGSGFVHLRVWSAAGGDKRIAVVTETGVGASLANNVESIWALLAIRYGDDLTLIGHWPASESPDDAEHLDVAVTQPDRQSARRIWPASKLRREYDQGPAWRRIWPVPEPGLDHADLAVWMTCHGHRITG